jgi:hypothetical protein
VGATPPYFITHNYYTINNLTGRNVGIYMKEATVSSANFPLSQGDCHPGIPIISFNHLSRPQNTLAISFQLDL